MQPDAGVAGAGANATAPAVKRRVAELLERHGAQLEAYLRAWRQATGEPAMQAGVFGVRDLQFGWKGSGR